MTLAEALFICNLEYNDVVRSFTPESEQVEADTVLRETGVIMESLPFESMVQQAARRLHLPEAEIVHLKVLCSMSIRFGMRVQRKLQSANAGKDLPAKDR